MSQKYDKLKTLLKELFQLDQPDLDFGLYRIMHAKSAEVTQFLEADLLPQVKQAFSLYKTADKSELEKELAKAIEQAEALGADPESLPKVKELRSKIANGSVDLGALESEVYDHLYSFFRRYYSDGDFLARRVYKPGVYAIPYEGGEVTLYWANRDQYYIKTTEYLRDYAFRLRPNDPDPMRVHFRLVDAVEGEHGNVKAAEGKERVFILADAGESGHEFLSLSEGEQGPELGVAFEYRPATLLDWPESIRKGKTKPPAQKYLVSVAVEKVLSVSSPELHVWIGELGRAHVNASGDVADYSRLQAHLRRYVARNTCDYFIHKDLGGFLRRELDFYVKNEVMHLDDIQDESAPRVEQYLSKIKVIRRIADKIITFLAQLEDFQKKLWLKKKFVVETNYCITLDRIPDEFYPEIAASDAQREEWITLFAVDKIDKSLVSSGYTNPLTIEFLKANNTLSIDTRHYPAAFIEKIIEKLGNVGLSSTEDLCVNSENFQALQLLGRRLLRTVNSIYIDPPYNTDATPIAYKNGYRHSSWLSLMDDRLALGKRLLKDTGILCVTIDDIEVHWLRALIDTSNPDFQVLGVAPIKNNPAGRTGTVGFSVNHEYAAFYGLNDTSRVGRLEHNEEQKARYKEKDELGAFEWTNFRKHGGMNTYRTKRPRQFYPIYVAGEVVRIPAMTWNNGERKWVILDDPRPGEVTLLPIDDKGRERIWDFIPETAAAYIRHFRVRPDQNNETAIYRKWRINDDGLLPQTWWDKSEYSAAEYGTNLLSNMFGETHKFTFPKSLHAVKECLQVAGMRTHKDGSALDFFAGSGTTGHAVIDLNRSDNGSRSFTLVEAGEHFDGVLLQRVRKAAYSISWKDGQPVDRVGRSLFFKYIRLESYEDALNNLQVNRSESQQRLLNAPETQGPDGLKEQYTLGYMLDVETRESQSVLNISSFQDPTQYKLRVKRAGSDESRETNVDLLETFNWLVGLSIHHIAAPVTISAEFSRDEEKRLRVKGRIRQDDSGPWWFRSVTGATPDGRKTLIIWRKLTGDPEADNLVLDEWFTKQGYSTKDYEFQLIYVNGDNNLENLKTPDDTWKVRLIEQDFHRLMFDTEGL